jgi:hypothetical protein
VQVVVESSSSALEYGDLIVDENSPVNPDLHFDSQLMHLYVMTERKVRTRLMAHYRILRNFNFFVFLNNS